MQKFGHEISVAVRFPDGGETPDILPRYVDIFGNEIPEEYEEFVEFFRTAVRKYNKADRSGWFTDSMSEKVAKELFACGIRYELTVDGKVVE